MNKEELLSAKEETIQALIEVAHEAEEHLIKHGGIPLLACHKCVNFQSAVNVRRSDLEFIESQLKMLQE